MAKLTRICYRCKEEKALSEFPMHRGQPLNKGYQCKPCCVEKQRSLYTKEEISLKNKKAMMKYKYNLTLEELEELRTEQAGKCKICEDTNDLVVDHNHNTDIVRGLLCRKCNSGLGMFKDNSSLLSIAAGYVSLPN